MHHDHDHNHDVDHDHDRGLAFDLVTMGRRREAAAAPACSLVDRRGALKVLGGLGLLALAGCGSESTTAGGASSGSTAGSCATIPEETAGPFPGDGSNGPDGPNVLNQSEVVRSDITSSFGSSTTKAMGVPLTIVLAIQRQSGSCAALKGAAVYLWHCDREGRYSLYDRGVTQENYLRGVQEAGSDGVVTFRSIYPGAYPGRWPHIHFEVFENLARATAAGSTLLISQLALPEAANTLAYATSGYERSVSTTARTPLDRDILFRDGAAAQTPSYSGDVSSGITMRLNVPV